MRHLRGAGVGQDRLTAVYCSMIRSKIEYASVVYGTMLTTTQSKEIERLQAIALKTIWGWDKSYSSCLSISGLNRLSARREIALRNFALKASQNERYRVWFPENEESRYRLRRMERYNISLARHERLWKAPIYAMRRILNEGENNVGSVRREEDDGSGSDEEDGVDL